MRREFIGSCVISSRTSSVLSPLCAAGRAEIALAAPRPASIPGSGRIRVLRGGSSDGRELVVFRRRAGTMLRRIAISLAVALATTVGTLTSAPAPSAAQVPVTPGSEAGPRFRADGPDADTYGQKEGYPSCTGWNYVGQLRCRVGAFSHLDTLFPSRIIAASGSPAPLGRAATEPAIHYTYGGQRRTLDQYLDAHHVTGFLIAKGNSILVERYQYGRTDKHRLTSFSMAKTVIALLIGIAVKEGAIGSIDDRAEVYVPNLKGTEYGRTPIRALLQMTSGVSFRESPWDPTSDVFTLFRLTIGQDPGGSLAAVKRLNTRLAEPGQRFSYSSAESLVLGLVLAGATRRTVSDYASEKLWGPMGAEADASWVVDANGQEITFAYFNAVVRDWARLGLMLAHGGSWQGNSIVPAEWVRASVEPGPIWLGYGYQLWLQAADRRMFELRGLRGQFVIIDPANKLVLVQTALRDDNYEELFALWTALSSQLP